MRAERFADAIILAIAGGQNLLKETQKRYFAKNKTKLSLVSDRFGYVLSRIMFAISWQNICGNVLAGSRMSAESLHLLLARHQSFDSFTTTSCCPPRMSVFSKKCLFFFLT